MKTLYTNIYLYHTTRPKADKSEGGGWTTELAPARQYVELRTIFFRAAAPIFLFYAPLGRGGGKEGACPEAQFFILPPRASPNMLFKKKLCSPQVHGSTCFFFGKTGPFFTLVLAMKIRLFMVFVDKNRRAGRSARICSSRRNYAVHGSTGPHFFSLEKLGLFLHALLKHS